MAGDHVFAIKNIKDEDVIPTVLKGRAKLYLVYLINRKRKRKKKKKRKLGPNDERCKSAPFNKGFSEFNPYLR